MMHRLQRMEEVMDRFLGAEPVKSVEDNDEIDTLLDLTIKEDKSTTKDDQLAKLEPPDLVRHEEYQKYMDTQRVNRELLHTYNRLNAIWKLIYVTMQGFFVTAEASDVTSVRNQGPLGLHDELHFSIKLTSSLFTTTLEFTHVTKNDTQERFIGYSSKDMKIQEIEHGLEPILFSLYDQAEHKPEPIRFKFSKELYKSDEWNFTPFDTVAELMDAQFVAYDILSQLQSVLRYNKTLEVVRIFNEKTSMFTDIPTEIQKSILENYKEMADEAATNQLRSLLLQCRPGFSPPMSLEYVRSSNLTSEQAAAARAAGP